MSKRLEIAMGGKIGTVPEQLVDVAAKEQNTRRALLYIAMDAWLEKIGPEIGCDQQGN
jgi:hypothetical protein